MRRSEAVRVYRDLLEKGVTAADAPAPDQDAAERPDPESLSNEELTRELRGAGLLEGLVRDDDDMEAEDDEEVSTTGTAPNSGLGEPAHDPSPPIPADLSDDA